MTFLSCKFKNFNTKSQKTSKILDHIGMHLIKNPNWWCLGLFSFGFRSVSVPMFFWNPVFGRSRSPKIRSGPGSFCSETLNRGITNNYVILTHHDKNIIGRLLVSEVVLLTSSSVNIMYNKKSRRSSWQQSTLPYLFIMNGMWHP